jgi:Fur family iron response transcriptional regulator
VSFQPRTYTDSEVETLLRHHGVNPTAQRVLIARTLFAHGTHLAAEDLFRIVNADSPHVSKATVYNTLGLLAERGLIRAVIADPARVFYDPNTAPHHHFYDESTGKLTDVDAAEVEITRLPPLPKGAELRGVDVVIRLKQSGKI